MGTMIAVGAQTAHAQSAAPLFPLHNDPLYRTDAAGTRVQPEFEPLGYDLGGFTAFPSVALTAAGDSNVFNRSDGQGDVAAVIKPEMRIASIGGRHSLEVDAGATITRFARLGEQDSGEYRVGVRGRIDLPGRTAINFAARYGQFVETRGQSGFNPPGSGPSIYRELRGSLGASTEFGNFRASVAASVAERRYESLKLAVTPAPAIAEDGAPRLDYDLAAPDADQKFRDLRTLSVTPRLDYSLSDVFGFFVAMTYSQIRSVHPLDCCRRDATATLLMGGVRFSLEDVVVGEVAVGQRRRNYKLSRFPDYSGLAVYAKLDWYPTELLSLRLSADQDLENSGLIDVASVPTREFGLSAYYELLRSLTLNSQISYKHEQYRGIGASANSWQIQFGGEYLFGRGLSLGFGVAYRKRSSSDPLAIASYDGLRGALTLTARDFRWGRHGD